MGQAHSGEEAAAWSRAEFLRRAALGGAGVILGGSAYRLLESGPASAAPDVAELAKYRLFVSRPDLRPPAVTVLRAASGTAPGLLFLAPPSGPGQRGPLIVDNNGDPVWFRPTTPDTTMDFRPGFYKGAPVLTWWEGKHDQGVGLRGSYVVVDTAYREIARFISRDHLKPDFHEFLLTPDGTALVTSYDPVPANLSGIGGPSGGRVYEGVVRELQIRTGRVLFEWRSLPHVAIEESYQTDMGDPYDYFHINSIGFDVDGQLLVSARNTWTIYKINRRTGEVIWRLGGKKSDFAMGKGTAFAWQHDARSHDGGRLISLFDNGPIPHTKPRSRGLVLRVDAKNKRATLERQLLHSPSLFAFATGNSQVLPNGNTLVCWGVTGFFTEYGERGEVLFDARLHKRGVNYRVFRSPWVGHPKDAPRLVSRVVGTRPRLFASWNGATEVTQWQLRTGTTGRALQLEATVPKHDFETFFGLRNGVRFALVVALDRQGKPLGTSNLVRV